MRKIKVPAHKRSDGTKVRAHTRHVHGQREEMSEKRRKRVGRQLKRGLTRLIRGKKKGK